MKLTWKCPSSNISPLKKFSFKFLVSHINKFQKGWVESGGMAKKVTFNHVKKNVKNKWCSNCLRILPEKECLLCNFWLSIPFIRFCEYYPLICFWFVCLSTLIFHSEILWTEEPSKHEGQKSQQLNKNIHRRLFCAIYCMVKER